MTVISEGRVPWIIGAVATLLTLLIGSPVAYADEPMLAVRQVGGETSIYSVGDIVRMEFVENALVVVTGAGSDSYPAETIQRVDFLWDFSAVKDPKEAAELVKAIHLFQNQPNPFSPETRIEFELPEAGQVDLGIYGVNGRLIRTLLNEALPSGPQSVRWDGRDSEGKKLASGVYFYQLTAPGVAESRQMILLP